MVDTFQENLESGKVRKLENGLRKSGISLKIRETQQKVREFVWSWEIVQQSSCFLTYFADFVVLVNLGLDGPIKSYDA